jgi:hypothetical protein
MSIAMIGLDTAKSVFQVHGVNETGKAELKRKPRRSELIPFFEKLEACTGRHRGVRCSPSLGPDPVQSWTRGKTDRARASQTLREKAQEERPNQRSSTLRGRIAA